MSSNSTKINIILNIIKSLSSILFPLITFPYVSRVLGPDSIGKVNFGQSVISYFLLIASLGTTVYGIRECSSNRNNKEKLEKVCSQIYSINICTTLVAYILLFLTIIFLRKFNSYKFLIIIQSSAIILTTVGTEWIFMGLEKFGFITLRTICFQFISLFLLLIFVKDPNDYLIYAAISVISSSGANLINLLKRRKVCKIRFTFKMDLKRHLPSIILLFVMLLAQNVFNNVDITMIGLFLGDIEVGIYSTAFKMKSIILQIIMSICWVMIPKVTYYFSENDWNKINNCLVDILSLMVLLIVPVVIGTWSLSKEIILIIGGESYIESVAPFRILMISSIFDIFGGAFLGNIVYLSTKRERVFMISWCISSLLNVILNYLLIPIGGVSAAAFTSLLSYLLIFCILFIFRDKRLILGNLFSVIIPPLVCSFSVLAICVLFKTLFKSSWVIVLLSAGFGFVFYIVLLLLMKYKIVIDFFAYLKLLLKDLNFKLLKI